MTLTRRGLLASAAGLAAGSVLWQLGCAPEDPEASLAEVLAAFPDHAPLEALGRAVLRAAPDLGDAEALARELEGGGPLAQRVAADFREGRVLEIEGWTLSRSEARLAALAALRAR